MKIGLALGYSIVWQRHRESCLLEEASQYGFILTVGKPAHLQDKKGELQATKTAKNITSKKYKNEPNQTQTKS